jgi:cysteinyl-tRNA synthetase
MLQLGGEKMSKSLGNIVSIKEFLSKRDADVMRMLVLNGAYRAPLIFNDGTLDAAEKGLDRLKSGLRPAPASSTGLPSGTAAELVKQSETTKQAFTAAMDDDFNTPLAMSALHELVKALNSARDQGAADEQLLPAQAVLRELTGVLGLRLAEKKGAGDADKFVDLLVQVRSEVRKQKLWALSDQIRDGLKQLGVTIEDNKDSTSWRWG